MTPNQHVWGSSQVPAQSSKINHKSLKSRSGAGKRKEKLIELERERFANNLALMARASNLCVWCLKIGRIPRSVDTPGRGGLEGKIRDFLGSTMEMR